MPEDFETVLRTGALAVAEATMPVAADLVRARGDRQQRRMVVAGGLPRQHGHPPPVVSRTGFSLRLTAPASYVPGVPNPIPFIIDDWVGARTVIVELNLGNSRYTDYHKAVAERFDQVTGRWLKLRVTYARSGWIASHPLRVGTGLTKQRLRVTPAVPVAASASFGPPSLVVEIRSGGRIVAELRAPSAAPVTLQGQWDGTPYVAPIGPGQTREVAFTVRNPARIAYPVQLYFVAAFCYRPHGCRHAPPGDQFQWLDGRTWRPADASAYLINGTSDGELLKTVLMRAGGSFTIRFRIIVGPASPSLVGQLIMTATPGSAALPGASDLYPAIGMSSATDPIQIG